jgi:hypothetical protein
MRYSFLSGVALAFLAATAPAHAVPILIADNNVGIRILNLEVGDTLYNVDFEFDEWPDVYGGTEPVFDFDSLEDAQAANEAVNFVLNGVNVDNIDVKQVGPPQEGRATEGLPFYGIAVSFANVGAVTWIGAAFQDNLDLWIDDFLGVPLGGTQENSQAWMWAKFTVVPVPAAAWLFGSALGLLAWVRRRTA